MRRNQPKTNPLADLRKRLDSANSDVRYHAYLDAQQLSAEQLWEIVSVPARQTRRTIRLQTAGCLGGLLWVPALVLLNSDHAGAYLPRFCLSAIILLWPVACVYAAFCKDLQENLYISISRLLEHRQEAQFAGPLLLIHAGTLNQAVRAGCRQTLLQLLPLLDDTHTQSWTATQKAALLELARYAWGDLELKFAALDALAQVGDADAVKALRELTGMQTASMAEQLYSEHLKRGTTLERQMESMSRRAAEGSYTAFATRPTPFDCLPSKECEPYTATALYLQRKAQVSLDSILERQERQRQTGLLLRSAEQPALLRTQELLRPVHEADTNVSGEQLLRPK